MRALRFLAVLLLAALPILAHAQLSLVVPKDLEQRLQLTPSQKAQFDRASGATQTALFSIGLAAMQMKGRLAAELAKDRPDFEALLRDQDDAMSLVRPNFEIARREWSAFYATLSAEQAKVAREEIDKRLGSIENGIGELARTLRDKLAESLRR